MTIISTTKQKIATPHAHTLLFLIFFALRALIVMKLKFCSVLREDFDFQEIIFQRKETYPAKSFDVRKRVLKF